jgi:hypothetical protein
MAAQLANHFLSKEEEEEEEEENKSSQRREVQRLPSEELLTQCGAKAASSELLRRLKFLEKCTLSKELGEDFG